VVITVQDCSATRYAAEELVQDLSHVQNLLESRKAGCQ